MAQYRDYLDLMWEYTEHGSAVHPSHKEKSETQ